MCTRMCFVKTVLEDQDDLSTDALTLHPRLLRVWVETETWLSRCTRARGRWQFVGVHAWAWAHVALVNSKDIAGTVLAKMSARRTPRHGRAKEQG